MTGQQLLEKLKEMTPENLALHIGYYNEWDWSEIEKVAIINTSAYGYKDKLVIDLEQ